MDLDFTIASGYDSFLLDLDAPKIKVANPVPSYFFDFIAAEDPDISSEDESQLQGYDSSYSSIGSPSASPRSVTLELAPDTGPTLRSPDIVVAALRCPNIIRGIVELISYSEFHSLMGVCRALRYKLPVGARPVRDTVFGAFVPGYSAAMALRDETYFKDVPANFAGLRQLSECSLTS